MLIVVREDLADPLIRLLGSSPTYNGAQLVVKGLRGTLRTTRRLGCYLTVDRIGAAHLPAPKGNAFRQDPAVPGTAPGELPSGVFRFDHRRKGGGRIPQRRVGKGDLRTEFPTDDRNGGIRPGPVGDMVDLLRKEGHMK